MAVQSVGTLVRQDVRLGIITPVATQLPRSHAGWEATAGIEEMARIAATADRLGFDHLTCSEHVAVPVEDAQVRGGTYWDPLPTLGYLAGVTSRIRLATYVLVLGYHRPLALAKRYGTLDRISGGRLVLGLGVGTLEREFDLLGAPFEGRGDLADDALRELRAVWGRGRVDDWVVEPHAANPDTPFWIGGRTRRSLRRAVELADGWRRSGCPPRTSRPGWAQSTSRPGSRSWPSRPRWSTRSPSPGASTSCWGSGRRRAPRSSTCTSGTDRSITTSSSSRRWRSDRRRLLLAHRRSGGR